MNRAAFAVQRKENIIKMPWITFTTINIVSQYNDNFFFLFISLFLIWFAQRKKSEANGKLSLSLTLLVLSKSICVWANHSIACCSQWWKKKFGIFFFLCVNRITNENETIFGTNSICNLKRSIAVIGILLRLAKRRNNLVDGIGRRSWRKTGKKESIETYHNTNDVIDCHKIKMRMTSSAFRNVSYAIFFFFFRVPSKFESKRWEEWGILKKKYD